MSKVKDLKGQRFGRLTVLEFADTKGGTARWLCQCDCGAKCIINGARLRNGSTKSCGCLRAELRAKLNSKHGMSGSKSYSSWKCMLARCTNRNVAAYPNYGGRGITVCDEWRNDFQKFFDYVSKLEHFEEEGYSLDRIDNDGNYEPGNVRWASRKEQARNRRDTVFVEYQGEKMTLAEAAERAGISYDLAWSRYYNGWHGEKPFKLIKKE